ncbi:MAG: VWA domain-containing protein [Deltaproteobacteria bacterium]|nr:VWA domain-containing protein [Deltaproteobacteria bacterium]
MKKLLAMGLLSVLLLVSGCPDTTSHSQGVYMLLDSSGTYKKEIKRAQAIINYLLGTLQPGDSFAVARIDSASFSEKDIIAKMTFDRRPSMTNQQKRLFKQKVDEFVAKVRGSAYTDITGGVLQAVEYLNETGAGRKHILIFSDLKEDLVKGQVRDFPIQVSECKVVALNVTKLRTDNIDPREYYKRVDQWKERVEAGGGHWRVVNDLERLESILAD